MVYVCMYVCMHACMHGCMYVCMYVYDCICMVFVDLDEFFEDEVANPRSAQCSQCTVGSVPEASRTSCMKCTGQRYALQGDEECRTCTFPAMILGYENWCTSLYLILFLVAFVVLVLFLVAVLGRFRLCCFKRRLRVMVEAQNWAQLHMTTTTRLEYGVWRGAAEAVLQAQKDAVYTRSLQLGISLRYAFDELEAVWLMFPPTIGLRDIEKSLGWSRCTFRTQLDPIALIQFDIPGGRVQGESSSSRVASGYLWSSNQDGTLGKCTGLWNLSHFENLTPINDLTVAAHCYL